MKYALKTFCPGSGTNCWAYAHFGLNCATPTLLTAHKIGYSNGRARQNRIGLNQLLYFRLQEHRNSSELWTHETGCVHCGIVHGLFRVFRLTCHLFSLY